ncbi:hypothetical protein M513_07299, partial [Trichuris suis]
LIAVWWVVHSVSHSLNGTAEQFRLSEQRAAQMTNLLFKAALLCVHILFALVQFTMSAEDAIDNDKGDNNNIPADDESADNQTIADSRPPDDQLSIKPESWVSIFGLTFLLGFLAVAVILKMVQACMPTKTPSSSGKNNKERGNQPNKSSAQAKKAKELCKQFKVWNYPGPPSFTETISIPSSTDTPSVGSISDSRESKGSPKTAEATGAPTAKPQEKDGKKKEQAGVEAAKPTGKEESPAGVCKTPQTSAREETDKSLSGKLKKQQ